MLICEAFVTDHTLTGADQHLVLGSSAFWDLVGPADCALRAHFHEKVSSICCSRLVCMYAYQGHLGLRRMQNGVPNMVYQQALSDFNPEKTRC